MANKIFKLFLGEKKTSNTSQKLTHAMRWRGCTKLDTLCQMLLYAAVLLKCLAILCTSINKN